MCVFPVRCLHKEYGYTTQGDPGQKNQEQHARAEWAWAWACTHRCLMPEGAPCSSSSTFLLLRKTTGDHGRGQRKMAQAATRCPASRRVACPPPLSPRPLARYPGRCGTHRPLAASWKPDRLNVIDLKLSKSVLDMMSKSLFEDMMILTTIGRRRGFGAYPGTGLPRLVARLARQRSRAPGEKCLDRLILVRGVFIWAVARRRLSRACSPRLTATAAVHGGAGRWPDRTPWLQRGSKGHLVPVSFVPPSFPGVGGLPRGEATPPPLPYLLLAISKSEQNQNCFLLFVLRSGAVPYFSNKHTLRLVGRY